ncbi:MAG TPA: VWA domain-containing protein [Thermoanaerobaculia bacterium]|jgi:VWFA-related protein|nr:VWA domain-containing protein [Thermoanaerobaculia bacterium]
MKASRVLSLAAVLSALCVLSAAGQTFTDTTRVTAVQIPVQVIADGKPVRGLTAADFVVYEGRKQRPVVGFDAVDLQTLPQGAEVPSAARRYFLMLFDMAFSEPAAIVRAREAAIEMLPQLHASDLVAVATYRRTAGIDMVLGFTSDRDQIRVALDSLGLPEMIDRASDPLKLIVVETDPYDFGETGGADREGPKEREPRRILPPRPTGNTYTPTVRTRMSGLLDPMFRAKQEEEAMEREGQKDAVDALAESFAELARLMRSVSGRKEVLFFSEGFDSALVQGTTEWEEQDRVQDEGSEVGAIWRVDSEKRFGSTEAAADLERMLEELRRSDCRVSTIDVSGLRNVNDTMPSGRRGGRDSLFQIARDTGGDLYENFNNLNAAVGKALERSGVTYVLTIQPEDLASDGAYHPLRVELRRNAATRAKNARVVHRPGYFSPRPFAERGKADREMLTSSRLLTGDQPGPVPIAVLATPYPKDGQTAWVPVLVEADGPALLADNGPGDLLAEVYIYAFDEQGGVRGYVAQALSLELARVETDLRQGGLRFLGHLELPPGRFDLRVLALNGRTGAYGLRTAKVEVPEMGTGKPVLLPPLFPEPPGRGVVTREATVDGKEVPFPFTQGAISYLPAPRPVLRSGEEAPVALVGYHLPAGDLQIRTAVLTPDGREVASGGLRVLGRDGGPDGSERLRAAFRPSALAPGEYLLRITVQGEGAERASSAPFIIGNTPGGP